MEVFWFFFAKKNKHFFLEKEAKIFIREVLHDRSFSVGEVGLVTGAGTETPSGTFPELDYPPIGLVCRDRA
jgi:hypothetical protein